MSKLVMATASGELHGLLDTLTNSVEDNDFKHMKPDVKAKLEKEKKEDSRLVKVEYFNKKGRHERLTKPYCRYAGEPIQLWKFIPGKVYEIPMGLIKEVNEKKNVIRSGLMEVDGSNFQRDGTPLDKDMQDDSEHRFIPVKFA